MQSQPHGSHPDRIEAECRDRRESGLIVNFNGQNSRKAQKWGKLSLIKSVVRGNVFNFWEALDAPPSLTDYDRIHE